MTPLQITLVIVVVVIFVTAITTYYIREKYYDQIDELDQQKKKIFNQAPDSELKEVKELAITGQSSELRDKLRAKWHRIESVKYPELENYLFEAEQATDRYRLNESKKIQDNIKNSIEEISTAINELTMSLSELIEREQVNLKKIDTIKKRYLEVRKSLLTYSFSFGPASETFEEKLSLMEEDFTEFSEYTLSGDHEEANKVIKRLSDSIEETEEQMGQISSLLTKLNDKYQEDIEDLFQGYEQMSELKYLFPEDNILEDIEQLKNQKNQVLESIRLLQLEEASVYTDKLGENIEVVYDKMETEIEAEPKVVKLLEDIKRAVYILQEKNRDLIGIEQRLSQSYVLIHNEGEVLKSLENRTADALEEYKILNERISNDKLPYSVAYAKLNHLFNQLSQLNEETLEIADSLENYRKEEVIFKNEMLAMEQAMYDMKRALDNKRLPGLPEDYLELFFSTTKRIEMLSKELSRTKVLLTEVRKIHEETEEDVIQLSQITEELIDKVDLIEHTSQRLYRFKDSHKGILETIRYSESLFNDDYDYDTALRLLSEKLENVSPGAYDKVIQEYEEDKKGK